MLGSIVEVSEDGRARIDAGSADGLRVGSVLTVQGRGDLLRRRNPRVVALDEHACWAEQCKVGFAERKTPLEAGWKVIAGHRAGEPAPYP